MASWRPDRASWRPDWAVLNGSWVLLNGLGRFQNALGAFQEAPEREILIFQWFWEVWGGAHARAIPTGGFPDPLNLKIRPNTNGARPMGLGKHKHKGLG